MHLIEAKLFANVVAACRLVLLLIVGTARIAIQVIVPTDAADVLVILLLLQKHIRLLEHHFCAVRVKLARFNPNVTKRTICVLVQHYTDN